MLRLLRQEGFDRGAAGGAEEARRTPQRAGDWRAASKMDAREVEAFDYTLKHSLVETAMSEQPPAPFGHAHPLPAAGLFHSPVLQASKLSRARSRLDPGSDALSPWGRVFGCPYTCAWHWRCVVENGPVVFRRMCCVGAICVLCVESFLRS